LSLLVANEFLADFIFFIFGLCILEMYFRKNPHVSLFENDFLCLKKGIFADSLNVQTFTAANGPKANSFIIALSRHYNSIQKTDGY